MNGWWALVLLPIGLLSWFIWAVAADGASVAIGIIGLLWSAGMSWIVLAGTKKAAPVAATGGPLQEPGMGQPEQPVRLVPGRLVHLAMAYHLSQFLGLEIIGFDGDVAAAGAVWVFVLMASLGHLAQAIFLRQLAHQFGADVIEAG